MPYYPFEPTGRRRKSWRVISPDGKVYKIVDNLPAFCREHKLNPRRLRAVARGEKKDYLGWKCELVNQ